MINFNRVADRIFKVLKGQSYQIKMFTADGMDSINPEESRRFYVDDPNLMITLDEQAAEIIFNKSSGTSLSVYEDALRQIKNISNHYILNFTIKEFGKKVEPKDFSYQAKNVQEGMGDKVKKAAYYAGYSKNDPAGRDNSPAGIASRVRAADTEFLNKIVNNWKGGVDDKNSPAALQYRIAKRELEIRSRKENTMDESSVLDKLGRATKTKTTKGRPNFKNAPRWATFAGRTHEGAWHWLSNRTEVESDASDNYFPDSQKTEFTGFVEPNTSGTIVQIKENTMNRVTESSLSKMFGSKKTSRQTLEDVQLLVKHKKAVDEEVRGSRTRNIHSIFLECNGERFRFPHNSLSGARAMARHMSMGGALNDQLGEHIVESTGNLIRLKEFMRYVRTNKLISEDTTEVVTLVKENIANIAHNLHKLSGAKSYGVTSARIAEQTVTELTEEDTDKFKEMFTVKRFDEKYDDVLPLVSSLVHENESFLKRIEESAGANIFLNPESFSTTSVIKFESKAAELGNKLKEVSSRIIENKELASFVSSLGDKMISEAELSMFDQSILSSVLENMKIQDLAGTGTDLVTESVTKFANSFAKYDHIFLD